MCNEVKGINTFGSRRIGISGCHRNKGEHSKAVLKVKRRKRFCGKRGKSMLWGKEDTSRGGRTWVILDQDRYRKQVKEMQPGDQTDMGRRKDVHRKV